jgi:hypothetical protein
LLPGRLCRPGKEARRLNPLLILFFPWAYGGQAQHEEGTQAARICARQRRPSMNVSSVSQQAYAMPQVTAQQLNAAVAVSDDSFDDSAAETSAASPTSSASTSMSGSTTATLSSQTLQALFNLTQNDPSSQQAAQGTQASQGAQPRHHHHHGGGGGTQQASAQSTATQTTSDPTASIAELDSSTASSDDSDSLATALGA